MKRIIPALLAGLLLMGGCVSRNDVTFAGVGNMEMKWPSAVSFTVGIENRSAHKLHLLSGNLSVELSGRRVLKAVLTEPVAVPRHFTGDVPVGLRLSISDPVAAMAAFNRVGDMTVSGNLVVRAGWQKKKICLENEPLSRILYNLDVSL